MRRRLASLRGNETQDSHSAYRREGIPFAGCRIGHPTPLRTREVSLPQGLAFYWCFACLAIHNGGKGGWRGSLGLNRGAVTDFSTAVWTLPLGRDVESRPGQTDNLTNIENLQALGRRGCCMACCCLGGTISTPSLSREEWNFVRQSESMRPWLSIGCVRARRSPRSSTTPMPALWSMSKMGT